MKKTEVALVMIFIIVIAGVCITFFVGWGTFIPGRTSSSYHSQPPADDATLWEKAEWDRYHGSIPQCGWFAEPEGPIILYPLTGSTISNISFRFALIPGEPAHDISKITYILSTRHLMKTVRYGDPAVKVTWQQRNGTPGMSPGDLRNTLVENDELVTVELDADLMGFGASVLGPDERFVLSVVPEDDCIRDFQLWGTTPSVFLPGTRVELSGQR